MIEIVEAIVQHHLSDLHTFLPAKIVKIDYVRQEVDVQPLIKRRQLDGDENPSQGLQDMAVIQAVPLVVPSAGTGIISFPAKVGDNVVVAFFERSVDNYLASDGVSPVDPEDYRKHDYNDAVAFIGLSVFSKALGINAEDTVIRMNVGTSDECKISLKKTGDVVIDTPKKFIINSTGNTEINVSGATTVTSSGLIKLDASNVKVTGALRVDGDITSGGDVSTDVGIHLNTHVHVGNLGSPTSPPQP